MVMELSNMLNSTTPTNPSSPTNEKRLPQTLEAAIAALDHETVRGLLLDAAKLSSAIHQATLAKYDEKKQFEQARTVDIRSYINQLATIWDRSGGERSFPDSTGAISDIESLIGRLETQVKAESSYATKRSALEALCEIGEWIVNDGESDLGRTIREEMNEYENRSLVETMCYVFEMMTDEEKALLRGKKRVSNNETVFDPPLHPKEPKYTIGDAFGEKRVPYGVLAAGVTELLARQNAEKGQDGDDKMAIG
ncbi:hypothetical protein LTR17_006315 [Elasticomyces elasticus]|nr:hypothetical protein LTR17_006315 [Elasticomyces elasticus]